MSMGKTNAPAAPSSSILQPVKPDDLFQGFPLFLPPRSLFVIAHSHEAHDFEFSRYLKEFSCFSNVEPADPARAESCLLCLKGEMLSGNSDVNQIERHILHLGSEPVGH